MLNLFQRNPKICSHAGVSAPLFYHSTGSALLDDEILGCNFFITAGEGESRGGEFVFRNVDSICIAGYALSRVIHRTLTGARNGQVWLIVGIRLIIQTWEHLPLPRSLATPPPPVGRGMYMVIRQSNPVSLVYLAARGRRTVKRYPRAGRASVCELDSSVTVLCSEKQWSGWFCLDLDWQSLGE